MAERKSGWNYDIQEGEYGPIFQMDIRREWQAFALAAVHSMNNKVVRILSYDGKDFAGTLAIFFNGIRIWHCDEFR